MRRSVSSNTEIAAKASAILRRGGLVALPTETVYGLAADAENDDAVRRVFAVKGRPSTHPVIVHVADARTALDAGFAREVPEAARLLAAACWPGPLTLVLRRGARAHDVVTGGQDTVALRVPAHPLALAVLEAFGGGVAAPSANRFGHASPTTAAHVRTDLGEDVELVVDGGACGIGVESTIVDLSRETPVVLRPGGVPRERVAAILGRDVPLETSLSVRVPGSLATHYAPRAEVRIVERAEAEEKRKEGGEIFDAGVGDPDVVARQLYARLRDADARGIDVLLVVLPEGTAGLAEAVRDRLRRAAGMG